MTSSGTSFIKQISVLEFETYGHALCGINELGDTSSFHIFEIVPRGEVTSVLLGSSQPDFSKYGFRSEGLLRFKVIMDAHEQLLPAYLNQKMNAIGEAMIVLESLSLGSLVYAMNEALKAGLLPVEFRFSRSGPGQGSAILTGSAEAAEMFSKIPGHGEYKVILVAGLTHKLKQFFAFEN